MADTEFKVGDLVELKSGSPKMTVSGVSDKNVTCTFFYRHEGEWAQMDNRAFQKDILQKVSSN